MSENIGVMTNKLNKYRDFLVDEQKKQQEWEAMEAIKREEREKLEAQQKGRKRSIRKDVDNSTTHN